MHAPCGRWSGAIALTVLVIIGCGKSAKPAGSGARSDASGLATEDAGEVRVTVDASIPYADAPVAVGAGAPDVGATQAKTLPAAMVDFEKFLSDLEKAPANAARAKRTCAIVKNDKQRELFFAVWKVPAPSSVPSEEWSEATEDYANMEYEIGDLCQDLDWDDDVTALAKLRSRFDRLVLLVSR